MSVVGKFLRGEIGITNLEFFLFTCGQCARSNSYHIRKCSSEKLWFETRYYEIFLLVVFFKSRFFSFRIINVETWLEFAVCFPLTFLQSWSCDKLKLVCCFRRNDRHLNRICRIRFRRLGYSRVPWQRERRCTTGEIPGIQVSFHAFGWIRVLVQGRSNNWPLLHTFPKTEEMLRELVEDFIFWRYSFGPSLANVWPIDRFTVHQRLILIHQIIK